MRHAATIAYDGTVYHGFQRQSNASTVQQTLEDALARIAGRNVAVLGSGRTDAGVHAIGQVVAFNLEWRHSLVDLRRALNANLPDDIVASAVWPVAASFHPRFDAISRTYRYQLYVAPVRDPLRRRSAWHVEIDLDANAMHAAATLLLGTHDFTTFGTPPEGNNSIRTVYEARWKVGSDGQHSFTITANAFLYRMVRTIVATLVLVGRKQMTTDDFRVILAACRRGLAAPPAPAYGLTLVAVKYSEDIP